MNKQMCILVLVGLPGSGKTSFAKQLNSFLCSRQCCVKCVSYDEIVTLEEQAKIALSASGGKTKENRQLMKDQVETFLTSDNISTRVVIIDDNNYYRSMRYEYYQIAAKYLIGYLQVYLQCSVEESVAFNEKRLHRNQVPEIVINRMNDKFEAPSEPWENCLIINRSAFTDSSIFDTVLIRIRSSIENPVNFLHILEEKRTISEQSRNSNNTSVLHKIDTFLRRKISELVRSKQEGKHALAQHLNSCRLLLLEEFKSGALVIPDDVEKQDTLSDWSVSVFLSRIS